MSNLEKTINLEKNPYFLGEILILISFWDDELMDTNINLMSPKLNSTIQT
jgi:hypothetical protein